MNVEQFAAKYPEVCFNRIFFEMSQAELDSAHVWGNDDLGYRIDVCFGGHSDKGCDCYTAVGWFSKEDNLSEEAANALLASMKSEITFAADSGAPYHRYPITV